MAEAIDIEIAQTRAEIDRLNALAESTLSIEEVTRRREGWQRIKERFEMARFRFLEDVMRIEKIHTAESQERFLRLQERARTIKMFWSEVEEDVSPKAKATLTEKMREKAAKLTLLLMGKTEQRKRPETIDIGG